MTRSVQVTFDAADPHALVAFWAELLGYQVEDGHDFVARMLAEQQIVPEQTVTVDGRLRFADAIAAAGDGPRLLFQRVPEPKTAKNRVHLDVPVGELALEDAVARAEGLGATLTRYDSYPGQRWAVLADPEGNEFCLQ